ncbi:hypothetical protein CONLIGDRAFT_682842 [Coniochaeta ligniaria NRRL 30616]|uniref:Uncharacterized protein n=1 Tax=Coniochaeta ligniaria NRRL 30616 TaxID=1408157 RepID=A0A1J7IKL5_9PEZI|nr:hypothetical protein CONLIGDRAFT_682842 [Coniochaeta ligniaria NRRL 30616]
MPAESVISQQSVSLSLENAAGRITETLATQTISSASSTLKDITPLAAFRYASATTAEPNAMPPRRTLTVRNYSSRPQSFVLLASPPTFAPLAVPDVVRHCVYQASLLVAPETGSHTFIIPLLGGQPSLEGTGTASGPVYAITGCARQKPDPGVTLFVSDVQTLQEGDGVGPGERCRMTMPDGFEAAFSKQKMPADPDDEDPVVNSKGTVGIETDNSFDSTNPGYPFVGLGAPNPYNPREIVPAVTWDAVPGNAYLVRPNLHTWIVARDTAEKGSIYDFAQSTKVETVSFTAGDVAAEVIFEKDGTFTLIKGAS